MEAKRNLLVTYNHNLAVAMPSLLSSGTSGKIHKREAIGLGS